MPTPYETLIQAAHQLDDSDAEVEDPDRLSEAELAAILQPNWAAIEQARAALRDKPRVAIRYEASYSDERCREGQLFRGLARYLGYASQMASKRGDFVEAARLGIDNLELAQTIRSGGLTLDFLIACAITGVAIESLRKIRGRMEAATCRMVTERIKRWEADRWPAQEIMAHDDHWLEVSGYVEATEDLYEVIEEEFGDEGLSEEEKAELVRMAQEFEERPPEARRQMKLSFEHRTLAQLRMLVIDLALRSYEEAEGRYPQRLTELEAILPEGVPLDPFTHAPFIYRQQGDDSFQLYSPGPSGVDHGGTFGFWPAVDAGLADLCLDAADYAEPEFSLCVPTSKPGFIAAIRRWCGSWVTQGPGLY